MLSVTRLPTAVVAGDRKEFHSAAVIQSLPDDRPRRQPQRALLRKVHLESYL